MEKKKRSAKDAARKKIVEQQKLAAANEVIKRINQLQEELVVEQRKLDKICGFHEIESQLESSEDILGTRIRAYDHQSDADAVLKRMNRRRETMRIQQEIEELERATALKKELESKKKKIQKGELSSDEESEKFDDSQDEPDRPSVKDYESSEEEELPIRAKKSTTAALSRLSTKRKKSSRRSTHN